VVVASAGGACWQPLETNAAIGLYAAHRLHIMSGPVTLYTAVPAGTGGFRVVGRGASSRERIRIRLVAPGGIRAGEAQSRATDLTAAVVVPAAAAVAGAWTVEATHADGGILEDFTMELPPPLPPVLSLRRDMLFH
jgi:hypothetical protein